jgi:Uri superfamily endonuclease
MVLPADPGSYALFLKLPVQKKLAIGKFGVNEFLAGFYIYFGSARGPGGLRARLGRHLRTGKKHHWHVDALRAVTEVQGYCYLIDQTPKKSRTPAECQWSQKLIEMPGAQIPLPGFGASDCKMGCPAHLLFWGQVQNINWSDFRVMLASALQVPPNVLVYQILI